MMLHLSSSLLMALQTMVRNSIYQNIKYRVIFFMSVRKGKVAQNAPFVVDQISKAHFKCYIIAKMLVHHFKS